ncbi:tetratricopeptide repeat protein [Myxococcus sp. CA039A]|uniref:tetratricopeptide repeat protein n=1 Tax=Myxococcus sp. CA039A TaxID=2741737 RepID=UPI00157AEDC4|nr:tetratricopeptide repeat protein [Myxococcus sp. CA039A]NTX57687.1 tetratricopeptide repeat protein [Myxococcus sp. CA039A]
MSASLETRRRRGARLLACVACLVLPLSALGAGPLERDHPRVQQGREAYLAGRYEDALKAFEDAKKERPNDPAVDFNRGDALAKLGRVKDAQEVFRGVTESNRPDLRQKAWYNLGNLAATTGDRVEALKSYRRALTLDPQDVQARHNYEVVLRNLPPPQDNSADGGSDGGDGGQEGPPQKGDGGSDGGSDGGQDEGEGDPNDGGTDGGSESEGDAEDSRSDGGVSPSELDRQEAERLLDAMKQNEKNLQLWRFQQKKKQRKANEKDW